MEEQDNQIVEDHPLEEQGHPMEVVDQQANEEQPMHEPEHDIGVHHHMQLWPRNDKGVRCDLQRMRNKASTDVSKASTDNILQRMSASTDRALTANTSTDKAING
ncbi:hypothetical protein AgCh_020410 [Apium graveolens]